MSTPPDPDATHTQPPADGAAPTVTHRPGDDTRPANADAAVRVPGYEVLGELGRGGMGVVYKARQLDVNRIVALKVLPAGADAHPLELARFQVEAEAVAALQHPGVVQLFEYGTVGGVKYLALEYVPGGTLAARAHTKPFTPDEAADMVARLASAVHAAHLKGILHRDLKPGNVLLTAAGEPKVADFGLARVGESDLTQTGAVMGTPRYMSPEQAAGDGRKVAVPSDVWALGAILYELLTGQPAFRRDTTSAVIHAVIHDEPVSPRQLNRDASRDLETVCLKCLRKDPADRYQSAAALAADLTAYLGGFPVAARPVGPIRRAWKRARRNPVRAGALAVLFGTGLAVGALAPRYRPAAPPAGAGAAARTGVWVERDRAAEDLFKVGGLNATVYRYTGGPVEVWLDLYVDESETIDQSSPRHKLWDDGGEGPPGPDQVVEGCFVWVRGEPDEQGLETWRVGHERKRVTRTGGGGEVANLVGAVRSTDSQSGSLGSVVATTNKWWVWPGGHKGETWNKSSGGVSNPIAEDRPVRLLEVTGGRHSGGRDHVKYRIRVMCQVVRETPAAVDPKPPVPTKPSGK